MLRLMGVDLWQPRASTAGDAKLKLGAQKNSGKATLKGRLAIPAQPEQQHTGWIVACRGQPTAQCWLLCESDAAQGNAIFDLRSPHRRLLDAILFCLQLSTEDLHLVNLCHTTASKPLPGLSDSLKTLMDGHQPAVIVLMGQQGAQSLLATDKPLSALRQQQYKLGGDHCILKITHSLNDLLQHPERKAEVWRDVMPIKKLIAC